jgi:hypothetical protein
VAIEKARANSIVLFALGKRLPGHFILVILFQQQQICVSEFVQTNRDGFGRGHRPKLFRKP